MLIFTKIYEIFHNQRFIILMMIMIISIYNTQKLNSNEENQQSNNYNSNPLTNVLELFVGNWICTDTIIAKIIEKDKIEITYENWIRLDSVTLIGNSCKIRNTISKKNDTIFTEQLTLKAFGDSLVYSAKTSQNTDTIHFVCKQINLTPIKNNTKIGTPYSVTFSNLKHDFPNFIAYSFIDEKNTSVAVLDNNNKGF